MKTKITLVGLIMLTLVSMIQAQSIIPEPVSIKRGSSSFTLTASTVISTSQAKNVGVKHVATYLANALKPATGFTIPIKEEATGANIQLQLNPKTNTSIGSEGYLLDVTRDDVLIRANTPAGLFYGVQTLLQLLPKEIENTQHITGVTWTIPEVSIFDYPRFAWRGLMLDVSRHFFSKEYVKSYIDRMARYKYNRFHWHLTDDNGWRLEIKSYPKLTQVGAWRVPRIGTFGSNDEPKENEKATDGGFYTQEDVKEIIQYAKERFVEILPEIDVPGHSMAAIAAYPELCVTKDANIKVNPGSDFSTWFGDGKFEMHIDNTLNPTDENVYTFLDKVFGEVAALFPFDYIHIGGDECYKGYWERDTNVQAFMKKNNIKNGEALQSYFTRRVSKIIISKKKKPIGWDEILEGGIAPEAAVMSWRGVKGGIEASHMKHPVVMSPAPDYYLDMNQGEVSIEPPIYNSARLKQVYQFNIVPKEVDSTFVLGGQANLWTEQIPTPAQAEYMTYPRAFAVAETLWTPANKKDWDTFIKKVEHQHERLHLAKVNYATSMYDPIITVNKNGAGKMVIHMTAEVPDIQIFYTFDNTIPGQYSAQYKTPVEYPDGADSFRVIAYRNGYPIGRLISFKTEELAKRVTK